MMKNIEAMVALEFAHKNLRFKHIRAAGGL